MSEQRYSVIFRGDLVPGYTVTDVKASMARLFKAGPETVEKLFSGRPLAIKKGLPKAQAEQMQAALAKVGAHSALRVEGEQPLPAAAAGSNSAASARPAPQQGSAESDWSIAPMEGNLIKEHEREQKDSVQVSVDHLSLKPAGGNLVEEGERSRQQAVTVSVPDWQLN